MSCPTSLTARPWSTDGYGNHMIPLEAAASSTYTFDDFFINSDISCPVTNCQIFEGTSCSDVIDPSIASIQSSFPYDLTINHGTTYDNKLCYQCETTCCTTTVTSSMDTLIIMDLMSQKSSQPPVYRFPQALTGSDLAIESSFQNFFDIQSYTEPCVSDDSTVDNTGDTCSGYYDPDPSRCTDFFDNANFVAMDQCCGCMTPVINTYDNSPQLSCDLYQQGCSTLHPSSDVLVASTSPFAVTAKQDTPSGYDYSLCYKCSYQSLNSQGAVKSTFEITYDNWVISQDNPACIGALTSIAWAPQYRCFQMQTSGNQILNPNGISDIFQNIDSSMCPIRECQLSYSPTCSTPTSWFLSKFSISSSPQFQIQMVNSPPLFGSTVCIDCQIGTLNYHNNLDAFINDDILIPNTGHADFNVTASYTGSSSPSVAFTYQSVFTSNHWQCNPFCQIFESDCSSSFLGISSEVYIESASPYEIKYYQNVQQGFSYNACLKCFYDTQTPGGTTLQYTELTKQFTITVAPDPAIYCENALTPIPWTSDVYLNNEVSTVDTIINPDGWKNFFTNFDESGCQIQSCQVFVGASCTNPLSSSFAEVSSISPFHVTVHQQQYDPSINESPWCVKCTTQSPSIYTFQNVIGKIDTGPILSRQEPRFTNRFLKQDLAESTPVQISDTYLDFFNNSEPDRCAPNRCSLLESDCSTAFLNSSVMFMDANFPFRIQAQINETRYTFDVCVKCEFDTLIPVVPTTPSQQVVQTQEITVPWKVQLVDCTDRQIILPTEGCFQCGNYEKGQGDNTFCGPDDCDFTKDILLLTGYCYECGDGSVPDETNRKCMLSDESIVNMPPMFMNEVTTQEEYKIDQDVVEFQIPEIEDANDNYEVLEIKSENLGSITVTKKNGETNIEQSSDCLIVYDAETDTISIDFDSMTEEDQEALKSLVGTQKFSIIISDTQGAQTTKNIEIEFTLEDKQDDEYQDKTKKYYISDQSLLEQSKKEFESNTFSFSNKAIKDKNGRPPITLLESDFTSLGLISLDFSEELFLIDSHFKGNKTLNDINENVTMLFNITYYCQLEVDEEGIDGVKLEDFPVLKSYKIVSFSDQFIQFKLEFSSPLFVSSIIPRDFISIQFLTNQLFMAKKDFLILREGYEIKHIAVPQQFLNEDDAERMAKIAGQAQNGLLATFIIPFVFMLFARVSLDRVWAMYYTLQLMTNMQNYMQLLIPANSIKILEIVKNVVCFRLFTNKDVQRVAKKYIFGEKTQWVKDILMDQGADVTQQVIFFTVLLFIFIGIQFEYTKQKCREEKEQMLWCGWLRGKITLYLPTCHLVLSHLQTIIKFELEREPDENIQGRLLQATNNKDEQQLSLYNQGRVYFKFLILVFLPIFSYQWLKKNFHKLEDPEFKVKFGTLYMNLNIGKSQALTFTSFFCLKRLFISFFTVFFNSFAIANVFVNIFSSLIFVKFLLDHMPMEFTYLNRLEILNETFLLFFNYFLFMFTIWSGDVSLRYQLGWYFVYIIAFVMAVNMALISQSMFQDSLFLYRKETAEKAWIAYAKLKVKMANFLAHEKAKSQGQLNKNFIRKERFKIHKTKSYKEMEGEIIGIFEERKRKSKAAILNSLLKFSLGAVGKNMKENGETPRFGCKVLAMMEKIENSEEGYQESSPSSESSSSEHIDISQIKSDLNQASSSDDPSDPAAEPISNQASQQMNCALAVSSHSSIQNEEDNSEVQNEQISFQNNEQPDLTMKEQSTPMTELGRDDKPTAYYEVEVYKDKIAKQLRNQMIIMREHYAHQQMVKERGFEDPYDTFDIGKDLQQLYTKGATSSFAKKRL